MIFRRFSMIFLLLFFMMRFLPAQEITPKHDVGKFVEPKAEYWEQIKEEIKKFNEKEEAPKTTFKMDFSGYDLPKSTAEFKTLWHLPPVSQGNTGTCWCFSTTSFFESEIFRLYGRKIKISEMYTVYWEYVEKARRFVRERGDSEFEEGSEANAVPRIWRQYGVVPARAYTGMLPGQKFHDHSKMIREMQNYLKSVKENNAWSEDEVLGTIKSILNFYLGEPPLKIVVELREMTPNEYFENEIRIDLDDYVDVISLLQKEYFKKGEYTVPDNWWHSEDYYNVPLPDFMATIKRAVRTGYSLAIGGDTSEPGYDSHAEVAIVATFDIPSQYIDEYSRQFRFTNKTTTDDHGIHIVGYTEKDGKDWYLIKDSGAGSRDGNNKGYYFYHEDYVKLKIMDFLVHKDMFEDIRKKFQN